MGFSIKKLKNEKVWVVRNSETKRIKGKFESLSQSRKAVRDWDRKASHIVTTREQKVLLGKPKARKPKLETVEKKGMDDVKEIIY